MYANGRIKPKLIVDLQGTSFIDVEAVAKYILNQTYDDIRLIQKLNLSSGRSVRPNTKFHLIVSVT
jgi:hypothetical protein